MESTTATIFPSLYYEDALAAIDWLCNTFGFVKRMVVPGPDGTVAHSELSHGSGVIMVGSAKPERGCLSPKSLPGLNQGLCVYVEDPDSHLTRAVQWGAIVVRPIEDEEYGARGYMAKDLEGHVWYFGNYRPGAFWTKES